MSDGALSRRLALAAAGLWAWTAWTTTACSQAPTAVRRARVVVVGGGFGGATAAKYLRLWSNQALDVTLVEPQRRLVSAPLSNLVLGGLKTNEDLTLSYGQLVQRHGVRLVHDRVLQIDADRRRVRLATGAELPYDRLILSPGIDFMWETLPGMTGAAARQKVLHAWQPGVQVETLRRQIESMPNGGVLALTVPPAPYRCHPGPYERACQIAAYFSRRKPRSKVLLLDANPDVVVKSDLFKRAWADRYPGLVQYLPNCKLLDVDADRGLLKLEGQPDVKAQVINLIAPMRAGDIALKSGLADADRRWCGVDFLSFESSVMPKVHVVGDAIQAPPGMPKSAHMANQHAKVCAAAVLALLSDRPVVNELVYNNACFSFVSPDDAIHVTSVHAYDPVGRTMQPVPGAGGASRYADPLEARAAWTWARGLWADTLF